MIQRRQQKQQPRKWKFCIVSLIVIMLCQLFSTYTLFNGNYDSFMSPLTTITITKFLSHYHHQSSPPSLLLSSSTTNQQRGSNICESFQNAIQNRHNDDESSSSFWVTTTPTIWNMFSTKIIQATIRHYDVKDVTKLKDYEEWIRYLFYQMASPQRLQKALQTLPSNANQIETIHDIIQKRYQDPHKYPPLKIAVFGGSLTAGHGCLVNPLGIPVTEGFLKRQLPCAWPSRLDDILNTVLLGGLGGRGTKQDNDVSSSTQQEHKLVQVVNMAMAATTSDIGATVIEYELWPSELKEKREKNTNNDGRGSDNDEDGPDIIMASFSTNDALAGIPQEDIYQNMQSLIQSVNRLHQQRQCRQQQRQRDQQQKFINNKLPMLIYLDDFIAWPGPVQQWLNFHHDLVELAEWYGIMSISYAQAFRDIVHASNLKEDGGDTTFKAQWRHDKKDKNKIVADPHPGMSFHIIHAWTIAFQFLHIALETCATKLVPLQSLSSTSSSSTFNTTMFPYVQLPSVPPPPLNSKLLTEDIPSIWHTQMREVESECNRTLTDNDNNGATGAGPRCAFVWIANRVSEFRTNEAIQSFMEQYLSSTDTNSGGGGGSNNINNGWKAEGSTYRSKHGWVTKTPNASFTLHVPNVQSNIRYITILYMKSYGNDWKDSRLQVNLLSSSSPPSAGGNIATKNNKSEKKGEEIDSISNNNNNHDAVIFELSGYHDSKTSVIVPYKFDLEKVNATIHRDESFSIQFSLIGGSNFKITGMAFCST